MKSVLLVDDHNLFRQILAVALRHRTDYKENVQAGSLAEAHQMLADRDGGADLAIVDLDLAEGDTTSLIHELHNLDVPVLAFTDAQSMEKCTRALQAGATEIINSASSFEEIVGVVDRLIGE